MEQITCKFFELAYRWEWAVLTIIMCINEEHNGRWADLFQYVRTLLYNPNIELKVLSLPYNLTAFSRKILSV